ncbi:MAG: hypothetical protein ACTHMS_24325 [Jatrophihabitans sp.]|uniref:hypothetical protein n=1 Tax=Jatrophihabitans sp. TaxID=1932789 RepID=UPI003F7D3ED8
MAVTAYLQRAALEEGAEQRRLAFRTELDRLEDLHAAYWPQALQGDVVAAHMVLKAAGLRMKLQGLDRPVPEDRTDGEVLVVAGTEAEYVEQLRAIASDDWSAAREINATARRRSTQL